MTFRLSHGLLCYYLIRDLLALDPNVKLQLDYIDQHWHYQAAKPNYITIINLILLIQNPVQVFGKGRPKGALGGTKKGGIKPVQPSSS